MDPIHQFEIKKLLVLGHIGGAEIAFTNSALYSVQRPLFVRFRSCPISAPSSIETDQLPPLAPGLMPQCSTACDCAQRMG
jgi:F-type H+-transporting ATPase subunit a